MTADLSSGRSQGATGGTGDVVLRQTLLISGLIVLGTSFIDTLLTRRGFVVLKARLSEGDHSPTASVCVVKGLRGRCCSSPSEIIARRYSARR